MSTGARSRIVDEVLPVFDVSDELAVVVDADLTPTWSAALMEADLVEVGRRSPLAGMLGGLRALPELLGHLLHGEAPAKPPRPLRLKDMATLPLGEGGWVLLGERDGEEIALGLVGKFWRPVIEFASVSAEDFASFDQPGFAKTVYAFSLWALDDDRTMLTATMRTGTTDPHARRWFRRYWTFGVGSGAHVLVAALLDLVREKAEAVTPAAGRPAGPAS